MAVAAGTYPETLELGQDHAGVHLAGRCRDLVTLDASVGDEESNGIGIDGLNIEVEVTGLSVEGARYVGVRVLSGIVGLGEMRIIGSGYAGVGAASSSSLSPTELLVRDVELAGSEVGLLAYDPNTAIVLRETTIRDTAPDESGQGGIGIYLADGADLLAEGCTVARSRMAGIVATDDGTRLTLRDSTISDTQPDGRGQWGIGLIVTEGAALHAEGCELTRNTTAGIQVIEPGSEATLECCVVSDTHPDESGQYGAGISVVEASFSAVDCEVSRNTTAGLLSEDAGTEVTLYGTDLNDTHPDERGLGGSGIQVHTGSTLRATNCRLHGNSSVGISSISEDTRVELSGCRVHNGMPDGLGDHGYGICAEAGCYVVANDCESIGNIRAGLLVDGKGTQVVLQDSTIHGTLPGGEEHGGWGLQVHDEASLHVVGCEVAQNTAVGIGADDFGTEVTVTDTAVRNTLHLSETSGGVGIQAGLGASVTIEHSLVESNTALGIWTVQSGSRIAILDSVVRGTRPGGGTRCGIGVAATQGASLVVERSEVIDNVGAGFFFSDEGTVALVRDTIIRDQLPSSDGGLGYGVTVNTAARLELERCVLEGNTNVGIMAATVGTAVDISDTIISGTIAGYGERSNMALGISASDGATIGARRLTLSDNAGPALHAIDPETRLICTDCQLSNHQFASAIVVDDGSLELLSSTISGSLESVNAGGGVGVYAASQEAWAAPTLVATDCDFSDYTVAGVFVAGNGGYLLEGNSFTGGVGVPHGGGLRCGDGVYAREVNSWDGQTGLLLDGNVISDNVGAGLFLDDAWVSLQDNAWERNEPDLLSQGDACHSPGDDFSGVPVVELCPQWDRPTCDVAFRLNLRAADPAQHGLEPPSAPATVPNPLVWDLPSRLTRPSSPHLPLIETPRFPMDEVRPRVGDLDR